ncbi:ComEA family DNA-binding protein [Pseudohongiella sp.]|uniref:Uncharacterized protein n=1 Tax=marine sediment metagenome TaxID=412755 RepID=A0A0F9YEL8_9ZZZZ|nr:ComEA family DNA-binding protein [Pseudohongiella sp.]HDZ09890.1 ComEA family DNA-binding protein [Pseudohongiella sp.]HEA63636.1 ComEA family DNA-binding protein [Pseudohongiella sp.]
MQTSKRFIKVCLSTFLFSFATGAAVLSLSAHAAQEEPARAEITVEERVNINTADAETLALALDGVGMSRAMDIIAYRETNGAFETVEQLQEVNGIGPATLERNRPRILLSDQTE